MEIFMVNAGGIALMAAIVWWFWLSSSADESSDQDQSQH